MVMAEALETQETKPVPPLAADSGQRIPAIVDRHPNVAFIISCARSGSSILGETLGHHPDIEYMGEENQALWHGTYNRDHHELDEADATPDIINILRYALGGSDRRLLLDKCPPNILRIKFLHKVFPKAKFIYLIRDGRDTACSLMPGVGHDEWKHLKPRHWRQLQFTKSGLFRCAALWQYVNEKALDDFTGIPHYRLRYEDLVMHPLVNVSKIIKFLGLEERPSIPLACIKITDDPWRHPAQNQDRWATNDHRQRVGRHRENMTMEQAERITAMLQPTLERLGYPC